MNRAAWMIAACTLCASPLALAQDFPQPASMMSGPAIRIAQAPAVTPLPAPQPQLAPQPVPQPIVRSLSEVTPTESMWFYEQQKREHDDPRNAVRANAEYRADQRRLRLSASHWFGYSNARPARAVTPTTTTSSPQWGSNGHDPFIWQGVGRSTVVHLPATPYLR